MPYQKIDILQDGKGEPLRFFWNEKGFEVESTGRRWSDQDGFHLLVMTLDNQVFELLYSAETWFIRLPFHMQAV